MLIDDLNLLYEEYIMLKERRIILKKLKHLFTKLHECIKYDCSISDFLRNSRYSYIVDKDFQIQSLDNRQILNLSDSIKDSIDKISNINNHLSHLYYENMQKNYLNNIDKTESDELVKYFVAVSIRKIHNEGNSERMFLYRSKIEDIENLINSIERKYFKVIDDFTSHEYYWDYENYGEFYNETIKCLNDKISSEYDEIMINYTNLRIKDFQEVEIGKLMTYKTITKYEEIIDVLKSKKINVNIEISDYIKEEVENLQTNPLIKINFQLQINNERIVEVEEKLISNSFIVAIGSKVKVLFLDENEEEEFIIKESYHGIKNGTIINELKYIPNPPNEISSISPIAISLIDKKLGEIVQIATPKGKYDLKIVNISWIGDM